MNSPLSRIKINLITLLVFVFFSIKLQAQTVYIKVVDITDSTQLSDAEILDASTLDFLGKSQEFNLFPWSTTQYSRIRVGARGYEDTLLHALNYKELKDKDTLIVALFPWSENLDEVTVEAQASWIRNKRIQAFERWSGGWCFLTLRQIFITDNELNLIYQEPLPKYGTRYAEGIYRDVRGNLFLLGKDSVTQMWILPDSIYYYPNDERKKFNFLIRPLELVVDKNTLLYRDLKDEKTLYTHLFREVATEMTFRLSRPPLHNCGVRFELKQKGKKPRIIYQSVDSAAYANANEFYGLYMAANLAFWRAAEITGSFDAALKIEMGIARDNYKQFHAKYRSSYWLKSDNGYILIDPFSKRYITMDADFKVESQKALDLENCPDENYVVIDTFTDDLWLRKRKRGLDKLHYLQDGVPGEAVELGVFVSNIRAHDSIIYYLDEEGQLVVQKTN